MEHQLIKAIKSRNLQQVKQLLAAGADPKNQTLLKQLKTQTISKQLMI